MPSLADIYSTIDSYKRKLGDVVGNPIGSLQQAYGNANDQARDFNDLTYQAFQEKGYGPKKQELARQLAEAYSPAGMTVWHGSPFKFKAFDPIKIGTGEGAQAFGHGLYVAENPKVAKQYSENVKDLSSIAEYNAKLNRLSKIMDEDSAGSYRKFKSAKGEQAAKEYDDLMQEKLQKIKAPGNMYKIDLPDEHINKMLDWDKTLINQPKKVQEAIKDIPHEQTGFTYGDIIDSIKAAPHLNNPDDYPWAHPTGQEIYKNLGQSMMVGNKAKGQVEASKALSDLGIPGIKYLDEQSRDAGEGTRNFVIFPGHEDKLNIQDMNGNPLQ